MFSKLLAAAGLGGAVVLASSPTIDLPGPIQATVVAVIDGDTLAVRARIWPSHEVETRVRLKGIDAPEIRGHCEHERALARAARNFLAALVEPARHAFVLRLHDVRWDKYGGRVVARVENAEGIDIGRALIDNGLARPYDGAARQGWCDG